MKKIDSIIRFIFMFVIFAIAVLQLLIYLGLSSLGNGYAFPTIAMYIYNLVVYVAFLVYNFIVLILYKLFGYKKFWFVSKKIVIISLIFTTALIFISLTIL